jgi:hypothetical protein
MVWHRGSHNGCKLQPNRPFDADVLPAGFARLLSAGQL